MNQRPRIQEILIFHDERPVVSESVPQLLERRDPFVSPFFRAVGPAPGPFAVAPRVPDAQEALAVVFDGFYD